MADALTAPSKNLLMPDAARTSQAEILEAAAICFTERGYLSTSIDDVARRLRSTKGRVYHHYQSKADLFFAVYRKGMEMNRAVVEPHLSTPVAAVERLRRMAAAHCRSMVVTRPYQRVVWEGVELHLRGATTPEQRETLAELVALRADYAALFRRVMEEAQRDGDIDAEPLAVSEQLMFLALNAPVFGLKARPGDTEADRNAIIEQCVRFAMAGLNAKRGETAK